jgi:superfamily II DNA/RNA helicase
MGKVRLENLRHLVLDEADKMLEMGFYEDIMSIIARLPVKRQTLLFSATMPAKIRTMAKRFLSILLRLILLQLNLPKALVNMYALCMITRSWNAEYLFKEKDVESMILFTSRKSKVNDIVRSLRKIGFTADGIHSDRTQEERDTILNDFKNRKFKILVATIFFHGV